MTEPLTPPDCDLRDFPFMPLDSRRLLSSETWVLGTAEERVAALTLWLEAWHQVPAGSLPDNPKMLAHLSGAGARWAKVAPHAMRGWVKCSDGRLYHPVVCEKARDAWAKKEKHRERSRKANAARWGAHPSSHDEGCSEDSGAEQEGEPDGVLGASNKDASSIQQGDAKESSNDPKGEGEGEGEREGIRDTSLRSVSPARGAHSEIIDRGFEDFWAAYPRKVGKDAARKAWTAAKKRAPIAEIAAGLNAARWPTDAQFIPHPATWLNQGRWQDNPSDAAPEPEGKLDWLREFMPTSPERVQ
jgi:hypothetical protein